MKTSSLKSAAFTVMLLVVPVCWESSAFAQTSDATGLAAIRDFSHADGARIYTTVCQGCHMAAGQGARGAGEYPALANNPKLAAAPYVEMMVLSGNGAMPGFKEMLTDQQVAQIATYVRTHFGNHFDAPVDQSEVKAMRASLSPSSAAGED